MMTLRKEDDDITQDISILRTNSLSQKTIRYACFKPEIVAKIHTFVTYKFFKNLKSLNFIQKLLKLEFKKVDQHPINSRSYAAAYYQTLEVRGSLLPEKNQKHKKLQIF